jgi:hypothetical protein
MTLRKGEANVNLKSYCVENWVGRGCEPIVRQTTEGTNCSYQKVESAKTREPANDNRIFPLSPLSLPPHPPSKYKNFVF